MLITERLRSRALRSAQESLAEIHARRIEAGRQPIVISLPQMPPLPKPRDADTLPSYDS